ncbi:Sulfotransferase 1C4 [Armadillidium vulgare]|nr:Sulfotransferase 1C4 [Armadillidium vulgare]
MLIRINRLYILFQMALKSGHRVVPVVFEEAVKQYEQFLAYQTGTIRLDPDGWFFTSHFITFGDKYYDFKFKPSDVVIVTYPKCGTTWTQEIVWTMMHNPNFDNPKEKLPAMVRSPFLDFDHVMHGLPVNVTGPGSFLYDVFHQAHPTRDHKDGVFLQFAELTEDPRIIKTHLPLSLLSKTMPKTCKVIYVARNPKDVAASYYHHSRLIRAHDFEGTMSQFVDHFVNDTLLWSPYWKHLKEGWNMKSLPNVHFMFYEDMKANPKIEMLRLKNFLKVNLTMDQLNKIVHYTSFEEMKKREADNMVGPNKHIMINSEVESKDGGFFRKGTTGDYKNKLSAEDIRKINKWTKE